MQVPITLRRQWPLGLSSKPAVAADIDMHLPIISGGKGTIRIIIDTARIFALLPTAHCVTMLKFLFCDRRENCMDKGR